MGTMPPNHQKLIVTGKNKKASDYATDMRTIEQWANEGIVRSLHAGSGITLNPSTGVDTGTGITISASGGSGSVLGHCTLSSGPDQNEIATQAVFLGPTDYPTNLFFSYLDVQSNSGASAVFNTMASSWIVAVLAGESIDLFPAFIAPTYTGGGLDVFFQMQAWAIAETNVFIATAGPISIASGTTYQSVIGDFTILHNAGGDLSLVAGPPYNTGTGVVSAAGGFYIASVTCTIDVLAGTTFT